LIERSNNWFLALSLLLVCVGMAAMDTLMRLDSTDTDKAGMTELSCIEDGKSCIEP